LYERFFRKGILVAPGSIWGYHKFIRVTIGKPNENKKFAGIDINANYAGKGKCGKCKIKIIKGKTNELTDIETSLLSIQDI
jgi:Na+-transporting NADH:ubiquinone oxidoreductase subunit NqrF